VKIAIVIVLWLLLFAVAWPLALAALVAVPILWFLSLPIRLVVWVVEACFALVKAILFLPARLLGWRSGA
jgi:hypothetical protein